MKEASVELSHEQKLQILAEWKKGYVEAIADALAPSGDVLQVGFEKGQGATRIQSYHPKSHVIVVQDKKFLDEAQKWAANHPNKSSIKIVQSNEDLSKTLSTLGKFDTILYNMYFDEDDFETLSHLFSKEINTEVTKSKELLKSLGEQMAQISVQYSDGELDEFYTKIGKFNAQSELFGFFKTLMNNKNITKAQYEKIIKKYHLEHQDPKKEEENNTPKSPMLTFLEACLKGPLKTGGNFSSVLSNVASKYEDSEFFDKIITNSDLDYRENLVSIKAGDKKIDGLVMIVTKSV